MVLFQQQTNSTEKKLSTNTSLNYSLELTNNSFSTRVDFHKKQIVVSILKLIHFEGTVLYLKSEKAYAFLFTSALLIGLICILVFVYDGGILRATSKTTAVLDPNSSSIRPIEIFCPNKDTLISIRTEESLGAEKGKTTLLFTDVKVECHETTLERRVKHSSDAPDGFLDDNLLLTDIRLVQRPDGLYEATIMSIKSPDDPASFVYDVVKTFVTPFLVADDQKNSVQ
ncbi:hypothetical protein [Vibrio sp. D431a]|uniref:hypothetical protein n=1 Tax=Vibrio sp. D431a TaxID=2837388 RepID=UPI0025548652|nr:hypothetical protein [Vibrio sp. D431a]MDK9790709.1 hypothetical protein [Vibrio sp. D431a]